MHKISIKKKTFTPVQSTFFHLTLKKFKTMKVCEQQKKMKQRYVRQKRRKKEEEGGGERNIALAFPRRPRIPYFTSEQTIPRLFNPRRYEYAASVLVLIYFCLCGCMYRRGECARWERGGGEALSFVYVCEVHVSLIARCSVLYSRVKIDASELYTTIHRVWYIYLYIYNYIDMCIQRSLWIGRKNFVADRLVSEIAKIYRKIGQPFLPGLHVPARIY